MVIVKVEKDRVGWETPGKTLQPGAAADHVHFVPDVLHVKVDGFFRDLAVTVVGTGTDCLLQKQTLLMTVEVEMANFT